MKAAIVRRLASSLAIIGAVLTFTFVAMHAAPGTPFMPRGDRAAFDQATIARLETVYGLDRPLPEQYLRYVAALSQGELGQSFSQRRPVAAMLREAVPNTIVLMGVALLIELCVGTALGIYQAVRARRPIDAFLMRVTLLGWSLPTFWLGLVLLLVFGEWLRWLPVAGVIDPAIHASLDTTGRMIDRLRHIILPALTLGIVGAAGLARFQRAATLEVIGSDFLRTARAKGLSSRAVRRRHLIRPSLIPAITIFGLSFPFLLTGSVVIESVFAWPGMGKLAADAIATRDYPVVLATTLLSATMVVAGSALADALTLLVDPRTRGTATA